MAPTERPPPRRPCCRTCAAARLVIAAAADVVAGCLTGIAGTRAEAADLSGAAEAAAANPQRAQDQMLVRAEEINYDYTNERVSAVGNVQIYYGASTLEANRVIYDQKTKRLHAEGNVRLTHADGTVTYGEIMDLSDDFRDGFVDSLRADAPEQTRFAATRAERSGGNFTVFHNGVYTACEPCKDDPKKPPKWQVKAARMIHDQGEKMMYFEDARLEFLGVPFAYIPYFSAPDPTVKRKSGFLVPSYQQQQRLWLSASRCRTFWALAPNYDLTFTPMITTTQGPLLQGEWRHRLVNGAYTIRATGIFQLDKDRILQQKALPTPGYRDWRGSVETAGQFNLSEKWIWGWDGTLLSDKTYLQDYGLNKDYAISQPAEVYARSRPVAALRRRTRRPQLFRRPRACTSSASRSPTIRSRCRSCTRNRSRLRLPVSNLRRRGCPAQQSHQPLPRPANFDPISSQAVAGNSAARQPLIPRSRIRAIACCAECPATTRRFSTEATWDARSSIRWARVYTPFVIMRADAADMQVASQPGVSNYITSARATLGASCRPPAWNTAIR